VKKNSSIDVEKIWILQLYREVEAVCDMRRISIAKIILELSDSRSRWGSCQPQLRLIRLSRTLIEQYPWDVVVEVLKHEMAHQLAWDRYQIGGHGRQFRQCAEELGVAPDFCCSAGDLPRQVKDGKSDGRIMTLQRRVSKLLQLAGSANEHEAGAALAKANSLIVRHNLELVQENTQYCYRILNLKRKKIAVHQRKICVILMQYFVVDVVFSSLFDAEDCQSYRTIEMFGSKDNVAMAEHVYYFLVERLQTLWENFRRCNGVSGRHKNSYWLGILDGFARTLAKNDMVLNQSALIPTQKDTELAAFIRRRHPSLVRRKSRGIQIFSDTYEEGSNDGARLKVKKPINGAVPLLLS